ncbi:MAG: tRNA 4-thiouridine(8) synthase ThiI [Candidatus Pacearchaeota archaeon]|jgi:tRNA U34 2-thiouridine synthase MnmA/TrmU
MVKALLLYSGGLDSLVVEKILEELGIDIELVFFQLPFSKKSTFITKNKLHYIDLRSGSLFNEYLEIIKKPKFNRGSAINPCKDCKIFMLKKAKELMEKIDADFIATGEVLDERPNSQKKRDFLLMEKETDLIGKILRPLSAKRLDITEIEKNKIINRDLLFNVQGRQRKLQLSLAKKYNINFPSPGGGCLLCEKHYSKKLLDLFNHNKDITFNHIRLLSLGRYFRKNGLIIVGKDKEDNMELEKLSSELNFGLLKNNGSSPSIIYENILDKGFSKKLQKAYSDKDLEKRKLYEKYKI